MDKAFEMDQSDNDKLTPYAQQIKDICDDIAKIFAAHRRAEQFPKCWRCKQEMCIVIPKDGISYYRCFEHGCNGRKEWSI